MPFLRNRDKFITYRSALPVALVFLLLDIVLISCHHATEPPPPTTVDTTSYNFVWTVTPLGDDVASSTLKDVAIINDTLAYAVGAVYKRDSLGNWDPLPFNCAKWNGLSWSLLRITVQTRFGEVTLPLTGVFAFSPSDIWFVGGDPIHGDGTSWNDIDVRVLLGEDSISLTRAWGVSSSEMYFSGLLGSLATYQNGSWHKLASGTTLPIQDIWGATNPQTGQAEVYAVASNIIDIPPGKKLLRLEAASAVAASDSGLPVALDGLWFVPGGPYYAVGDGVFSTSSINTATTWKAGIPEATPYFTNAIRGNASNDIVIAGAYGDLVHYNGSTWKSYQPQTSVVGNFWALAMKGNMVIAVGDDGARAYIAVGKRQ